jgi:glyoxylase-like metal-dependent hydrolase (beta-lactamase superfamily II)/rhodanese-related sulfurtransferase
MRKHRALRFRTCATTLMPMPPPPPPRAVPHIPAFDLARRLDAGERVQVLDVRSSERVALGRVTFGATLDFRAVPASEMYGLSSLEPLRLDRAAPVAVICGHGNSSKQATAFLCERGFDAYSVTGGMAAWETVYLPRRLSATPALEHVIQLDRVGKGALSYVLVSEGDAVVVDPGRHLEPYEAVLQELGATAAAVVDTHMHADYLSGARAAARRWRVPYFLHSADARSPYDGAAGRFSYEPLGDGDTIALGRATLEAVHVPGHTLGSLALVAAGSLALTGDFLFVQSVGRPDLGGQRDLWTARLWESLERARREWPPELLVLPAHYASERERRADRSVAARLDVIAATNEAAAIQDLPGFRAWVTRHATTSPASYRTIKLANLGLVDVSDAEAETLEFGPNACAVG